MPRILLQQLPQILFSPFRFRVTIVSNIPAGLLHLTLSFHSIEVKELINGYLEKGCNCRDHGNIRQAVPIFPLAHRLKADAKILGQYLLR